MKDRLLCIFLILICFLTACTPAEEHAPTNQEITRVEQALEQVWGGDVQRVRETEVYEFPFSDAEGNTIVYYLCETTYFQEEPAQVTGLDTQALYSFFDTDYVLPEKKLDICGHPGALYLVNGRAFFCCTASPKSTVVLEYSPEVISEETATKIIHSIFEPVE